MKPLRAPVFDVQRFSIHDGPGIRTLVFFKGCSLHCAWCQNPESQQVAPQLAYYAARCQPCAHCRQACAEQAIRDDGYRVDHARCTLCLACVRACPHGALQAIGEYLTPEQLLDQLLADRVYYASSGGGVTFSGGEPTLHPDFMERLLDLCRAQGIHTTLETCGLFSYARWTTMLSRLNLIYFDLKIMDEAQHQQATGQGNRRILDNARKLVEAGYPVEFRLTLVPGYTDTPENLAAVACFVRELGRPGLHLLGYHNMGEAKIDLIHGSQPRLGLTNTSRERLHAVRAWFEELGLAVLNEE